METNYRSDDPAPLHGVKVLEIAHYIAGPHAAMILADHGAEVVKIEPPGGEAGRFDEHYFAAQNRNKRSICLNLGDPKTAETRDRLLAWADIVVTNYTLGVPEKLGFNFERLQSINPRASLIHVTGYGSWTPRARHGAYDGAIQSMSGFAELNGTPDTGPMLSTIWVADHSSGMQAANAALCAILKRGITGRGTYVEVSMICAMTSMLGQLVGSEVIEGNVARGYGNRYPARPFVTLHRTLDGYLYLAPITLRMWKGVAELLDRPDWYPDDGRSIRELFADAELQGQVNQVLAEWASTIPSKEAVQLLQAMGVACSEVRGVRQIYEEAIAENSGEVISVRLADGRVAPSPGPAFRMAGDPDGTPAVPQLGEHTDQILAEMGITPTGAAAGAR